MTVATAETGQLDIGKVIQDVFAVLGRNFVPFLALSAILAGIPAVLIGLIQASSLAAGLAPNPAAALASLPQVGLVGLVSLVAGLVLQGTIVYGAVSDMNGRHPTLSQCLSVGLNHFLGLFAIALLAGLAIFLGFMLLIVPGLMLWVAWSVVVPAYVAEQIPIMQTFGRSADLTRGNRWRIFALFLVYLVAAIVVQIVVGAVGGIFSLGAPGTALAIRAVIVQPVISTLNAMIGATGAAVLYTELRRVREGVGPEALASVFD